MRKLKPTQVHLGRSIPARNTPGSVRRMMQPVKILKLEVMIEAANHKFSSSL